MDIWAVEYSPVQGVFHIDTLARVLAVNRETVAQGKEPGFILLYLAASSAEAHVLAEQWRREHTNC